MNYKLIVTKEHLHAITQACELFARVCIGQVEEVGKCFESNPDFNFEKQMLLREKLEELHVFLMGSHGSSYGVGNKKCPKAMDICWEIKKTIDQLLAYERQPEGGHTVDFQGPLHLSGVPLPEIMPTDESADLRPYRGRLADQLQEIIGTNDLAMAVSLVKSWKQSAINHEIMLKQRLSNEYGNQC